MFWNYNNTIGSQTLPQSVSSPVVPGQWQHFVWVMSTTNVYMYCDGVQVYTTTVPNGISSTYGTTLFVGSSPGSGYFNEEIAQVTFYNVALTQAQVTARYNNLTPAQLGITPVSQLNMTEGSGTTLHDAYGNSNFTLTGSPIWTADSPGKSRIIIPKMRTRLPGIRQAA